MPTLASYKPDYAGLRYWAKARSTGTHIGIYDGIEAEMDTGGGRWQTVCEEHGSVISHQTLELARQHGPHPEEWCEFCMGVREEDADDIALRRAESRTQEELDEIRSETDPEDRDVLS